MDDFIDQMLSTPQWAEGRWANPESLQGLPKLTSMSLMPMSYSGSGSFETQQQVVVGGNMELQSPSLWHHHLSSMPSQGFSQQQDLKPVETMQLGKRCRSGDVEATISGGNMTDQVCSPSTPQNPNGGAKPRVRARRGQATDPHSIAERNRRERIAERMKSLQELVPDANKTDKASMLDEIITYIRFLQMQVKCLSACRLGGAGVAATDLIAESASNFMAATLSQSNGVTGSMQDGMVFVERQVARLMDEDMSLAMQYLQSKGLCLMPISLATAISGATPQRQSRATEDDGMEKQQSEANGQCMIMEAFGTRAPPIYETNFTEQGAGGTPKTPISKDEINCEKTIFGAFENN